MKNITKKNIQHILVNMSPLFTDVSVVNKVSNIVTMVIATVDIIYNDDVNGVASVLGFRSYSCSIDLCITFTLLTFFPPQLTRVCDVHVDFFLWKLGIFVLFSIKCHCCYWLCSKTSAPKNMWMQRTYFWPVHHQGEMVPSQSHIVCTNIAVLTQLIDFLLCIHLLLWNYWNYPIFFFQYYHLITIIIVIEDSLCF